MLIHHNAVLNVEHPPHAVSRADGRRAAAASLFVVAWLAFGAFVALYRGPLPAESFTALAVQIVDAADMARTA